MQLIDIDQMRDQLLPVDTVKSALEITEHLSEHEFKTNGESEVRFTYPTGWQDGLDPKKDGLVPTSATVVIDGVERGLTLGAALDAGSTVGLQKSYTLASPGELIERNLNHWYNHDDKNLKLLASANQDGVAFTRATIHPFSNVSILDAAIAGIQDKYNTDDILVDYKFHHDIKKTSMRLIVPSTARGIASARAFSYNDPWSVGLDISNSVSGASSLELRGYLFAWWCTNGSTSTHAASGKYRRKPSVDVTDAYEWTRSVVDEVLGGLEAELDAVEALTLIPLEGELNETLTRVFDEFDIPVALRAEIIENIVSSEDFTAYGLMNAITAAANGDSVSPSAIAALLGAGGSFAHAVADRCQVCHRF